MRMYLKTKCLWFNLMLFKTMAINICQRKFALHKRLNRLAEGWLRKYIALYRVEYRLFKFVSDEAKFLSITSTKS